jgi:hypothetical protein
MVLLSPGLAAVVPGAVVPDAVVPGTVVPSVMLVTGNPVVIRVTFETVTSAVVRVLAFVVELGPTVVVT